MHNYRVHGLAVCSALALDLPTDTGGRGHTVGPGCANQTDAVVDPGGAEVDANSLSILQSPGAPPAATGPRELLIRYDGGRTFLISDGREVVMFGDGPADDAAQEFLTGPAIALSLFQRGSAVLHASAVLIKDTLVAFAGPSGAGKSTLAAALTARGHHLFADDFVALPADGVVHAGAPRIRLWPDAAAAVIGLADHANAGDRSIAHRAVAAEGNAEKLVAPQPVGARIAKLPIIFFVEDGEPAIAPVPGSGAVFQLMAASYCVSLLASAQLGPELDRWAAIASATQCFILRRPRNFERLDEAAAMVEHFVRTRGHA